MNQQPNIPTLFDSFYAANQETETTRRRKAAANAFYENIKDKEPKIYHRHKKLEASLERQQLRFEASINTPETIALINELREQMQTSRRQKWSHELVMLGLDAITTKSDVRNAYRRKARKLHPDAGGDEEAFKQLHTAYRTLLKEAKA